MTGNYRVAVIAPNLDATAGGVETFCTMLKDSLINHGYEARIFAPPSTVTIPTILDKLGLSHLVRSHSLRSELEKWKPDTVISSGTLGFFGSSRWKHVHVFHGTMVAHNISDRRGRSFKDWLVKGVLGGGISEILSGYGATRVAVSSSCAREVERFYKLKVHRVIPNGVYLDAFEGPPSSRDGLIFVGRRESRKGYEVALRLAQYAGEALRVAGPGEDARTINHGVLSKAELQKLYRRSTAMIFPSNYEACSFAILESLCAGCAVITTPIGWVTDLLAAVPEYSLLVAERGDERTFEEILQRVLAGDDATQKAVAKAAAWTRTANSFQQFARDWIELLENGNGRDRAIGQA